jgi:hypothetical protein
MGVSVQEYRARIGAFNSAKGPRRTGGESKEDNLKMWFCGLVIVILLVIGGVEVNPGPLNGKEEADIFQFIRKAEESGAEVKRFMQAIEKNLAGIDAVIKRQSEMIDEGNKTMKGLENSLNKTRTELEVVRTRQSKCEWKIEAREEEARRNNLIILGMEETNGERYEDTQRLIERLVIDKLEIPEIHGHVDYVKRLGRGRGSKPILVKLTTFAKKLEILENTRKLAGTKIRVEQDYSREV